MSTNLTGKELPLFKAAVAGLVRRPHPNRLMGLHDLVQTNVVYARVSAAETIGYLPEAAKAIQELASLLHRHTQQYQRGTEFTSFSKAVADCIFEFVDAAPATLGMPDLNRVLEQLAKWFAAGMVRRTHYVPCALTPHHASSFSIGPVRFVHAATFWAERPSANPIAHVQYETFLKALGERHGSWVAIVNVEGAEQARSVELADLATDISIGVLQLFIPLDESQLMARVNGRAWPSWTSTLFHAGDDFGGQTKNLQPGRAIPPEAFDQMIQGAQPLLDSAGRRIEAFLDLPTPLKGLERSWCDAVYWFHDTLAEPIHSLAVAKLETTIEVLLTAESTKGSEAKILFAFQVFLGLSEDQFLGPDSPVTVKIFAKALVQARSKVLHGTSSTLANEMSVSLQDVEALAREFILRFTLYLDEYLATSPADSDDPGPFLEWVGEQVAAPEVDPAPAD